MTAPLRITKSHGLGNDFLVALESRNEGLVPSSVTAKSLCDRHRGIGADGMIFGLVPDAAVPPADVRMVLFNSDGSEAEISGNGIRCLGQAVLRAAGRREGTVVVDGAAGRRTLVAAATDDPAVDVLRVEMGEVTAGPELPPSALALDALHRGAAAVGNPHVVLHVASLADHDVAVVGPAVEHEVPGGANVHLLVVEGPDAIRLVHWERGAGVTEACGSGATVAAHLAHGWGLVGDSVEVRMPGGVATVDVGSPAALAGEAVHIAEIIVDVDHAVGGVETGGTHA